MYIICSTLLNIDFQDFSLLQLTYHLPLPLFLFYLMILISSKTVPVLIKAWNKRGIVDVGKIDHPKEIFKRKSTDWLWKESKTRIPKRVPSLRQVVQDGRGLTKKWSSGGKFGGKIAWIQFGTWQFHSAPETAEWRHQAASWVYECWTWKSSSGDTIPRLSAQLSPRTQRMPSHSKRGLRTRRSVFRTGI